MRLRTVVALFAVALSTGACSRDPAHVNAWIYISNYTARSVTVFDGRTLARVANIALPGAPHSLTVEPGNRRVWTANVDGNSVSVIDVASRSIVKTITVCGFPERVAFVAGTGKAFVACGDGYLSVVDTSSFDITSSEAIGFQPHDLAVGPAGHLWAANRGSNDLSEIDPATGKLLARFAAAPYANGVAFSKDATYGYVASKNWNSVVVLLMSSKQILGAIKVGKDPQFVSASRDGNWIYVSNGGDGTLSIVNARTFQVAATIPVGANPHGLTVSADGKLVFVASQTASVVSVVDTQSRKVVKRLVPQQGSSDVTLVPIAG